MLQPKGDLSYEELLESYTEQVTAVANAGVDLLVAETMLSVDETCVFMDAALSVCDLPIMCSLTLEADGSACSAETLWKQLRHCRKWEHPP